MAQKVRIKFDAERRFWIAVKATESSTYVRGFRTLVEAVNWAHGR